MVSLPFQEYPARKGMLGDDAHSVTEAIEVCEREIASVTADDDVRTRRPRRRRLALQPEKVHYHSTPCGIVRAR